MEKLNGAAESQENIPNPDVVVSIRRGDTRPTFPCFGEHVDVSTEYDRLLLISTSCYICH